MNVYKNTDVSGTEENEHLVRDVCNYACMHAWESKCIDNFNTLITRRQLGTREAKSCERE